MDASVVEGNHLFSAATALPLVFSKQVLRGGATFATLVASALGLPILLELLTGLRTFPLWLEILLVPLTVGVSLWVGLTKKDRTCTRLEFLLGLAGLALLLWSVGSFLTQGKPDDWILAARTGSYVVILSALMAGYAICFGTWATFEEKFVWLNFRAEKTNTTSWRAKIALHRVFWGRTATLGSMAPVDVWPLVGLDTIDDSVKAARAALARRENKAQEELDQANRLIEFADVEGEDAEGAQLDRREFEETKAALLYLQTCMMGWYSRSDEFRSAVLETASPFTKDGLPVEHGIAMKISKDHQQWYAWRKTVSGWVFSVGQSHPRDDW